MKRVQVIMNEQHKLLPEQEELLKEKFGTYDIVSVPSEGWTLKEQGATALEVVVGQHVVVFVSPVPYLMVRLAGIEGYTEGIASALGDEPREKRVYVFHNDMCEREYKLPNGTAISVTAKTGWELV